MTLITHNGIQTTETRLVMAKSWASFPGFHYKPLQDVLAATGKRLPYDPRVWTTFIVSCLGYGRKKPAILNAVAVGLTKAATDVADGIARDPQALAVWHACQWIKEHGKTFRAPKEEKRAKEPRRAFKHDINKRTKVKVAPFGYTSMMEAALEKVRGR